MTTAVVLPLEHAQLTRINVLTSRFGCGNDFDVTAWPGGHVRVRMGAQKGRVRTFIVSPAGSVRAL